MDNDLISRSALCEKLQAHKDFFVNAWGGFGNLPPKDKARVDEITHCIAETMNAPAVDAVEVVRCEDCIHRSRYADSRGHYICNHPGMSPDGVNIWVSGDHFCGEGTTQMPELAEEDEVVRCRDCKHFKRNLENDTYCQTVNGLTDPEEDDFCSYGERRANND